MTNAELKKQLTVVQKDSQKLRERVSDIRDELATLRSELDSTRNMIRQDMEVLVGQMERRRIL
jgi:peptidoglycan hydrolase CwlO-like protein